MNPDHRVKSLFARYSFRALLALGLLIASSAAHAAPLVVGGTVSPVPSTFLPTPLDLGGTVVGGPLVVPFSFGAVTGVLTSVVLNNDPDNPFGTSDLTFAYQFTNTSVPAHSIQRLTAADFTGFSTDVAYASSLNGNPLGAGTVVPTDANRSSTDVVGFDFLALGQFGVGLGLVNSGSQSDWLVVRTNSTTFTPGFASIIDGGAGIVASYSPVPEPSTIVLFALGAAGLWYAKSRRQAQ